MTRTKTTTPTNKNETAQKAKPSRARSSKTTPPDADNELEPIDEKKPLNVTIGEALIAKGAKPANEVQVINFDRRLPVALTPGELKDRAKRIQELRRVIKMHELALSTEIEEHKKRKASLESDISKSNIEIGDLADQIGDEAMYRDVRCQRIFDYQLMQVREVRTDMSPPKALQEPRPMTAREVEEGYTNADGKRSSASPAQTRDVDDDDLESDNDDPELDLD